MTRTADRVRNELLVLRAQDGDGAAFDELVQLWQPRLLGYAIRLTGRADLAQDAVQDTWAALIRDLDRLRDPASFSAFAHRVLARRCADTFRRQRTHDAAADALDPPQDDLGPEALAAVHDDRDRVRAALSRLPDGGRTVLALHYLEDLSLVEIARILEVPEGTVKSRLHRARTALRRAFEERRVSCPSLKTSSNER